MGRIYSSTTQYICFVGSVGPVDADDVIQLHALLEQNEKVSEHL